MRASENGRHISGAEEITSVNRVGQLVQRMAERAAQHPKGEPGRIAITVERIAPETIHRVAALPVVEISATSCSEAERVAQKLTGRHTAHAADVWESLVNVRDMRGAMLIDADTGLRLEPDPRRGVRLSRMGLAQELDGKSSRELGWKSAPQEALVLASKALSHPDVVAEICISDDPEYTTGYVADASGYHRIEHMKEHGSLRGGRALLCRTKNCDALIDYLENTPVVVEKARDK